MYESGYYPAGAEYDPRAPWNEREPTMMSVRLVAARAITGTPTTSRLTTKRNVPKKHGICFPIRKRRPLPSACTTSRVKRKPARCAMVRAKWNMNPIMTTMTKTKAIINPDEYYQRSEVSNSDLTELKNQLHPHMQYGDREAAFRFGSIVDAIITEPSRVDFLHMTIDGEQCSEEEFLHAREMQRALRAEARRDPFLAKVLELSDTQRFMVNKAQEFENGGFRFTLDTRCKWDWWLPSCHFGGDLKTTFASTQAEFDNAVDFFDWDRSRAWYMDIAHSDRDFIYAISKKNCRIFKKFIERGDDIYNRGREKYEELAFQYWAFNLV